MHDLLQSCTLCPRTCGVNRLAGETGVCGETANIRAARAALHFWEEPCISGASGSGAVFFSGCSMGCVYCQNQSISHGQVGFSLTSDQLAAAFLRLQEQGANNINLVTPTHFIPQIKEALLLAKARGLLLPIVYNSSGYERPEILRELDGLIDIYLPDFKYFSTELSTKYSHCPDYTQFAKEALAEMVRQVGAATFSGNPEEDEYTDQNLMTKGVLVRHLLLPGALEDSKQVLSYLYHTYGDSIFISIMSQYTPLAHVEASPELNRRITEAEYNALIDYAIDLGISNAFIQGDGVDEESFIPQFNGEGLYEL